MMCFAGLSSSEEWWIEPGTGLRVHNGVHIAEEKLAICRAQRMPRTPLISYDGGQWVGFKPFTRAAS